MTSCILVVLVMHQANVCQILGLMISQSHINCKIELIDNFPCNNEEELNNRKNKIFDKLTKK